MAAPLYAIALAGAAFWLILFLNGERTSEVDEWMRVRNCQHLDSPIKAAGIQTIEGLSKIDVSMSCEGAPQHCTAITEEKAAALKWLAFRTWLEQNAFDSNDFLSRSLTSPEAVMQAKDDDVGFDREAMTSLQQKIVRDRLAPPPIDEMKTRGSVWSSVVEGTLSLASKLVKAALIVLICFVAVTVVGFSLGLVLFCFAFHRLWPRVSPFFRRRFGANERRPAGGTSGSQIPNLWPRVSAFFRRLFGANERQSAGRTSGSLIPNYIWWLAHSSLIEWTSKDPLIAGQTLTFRIKILKRFGGSNNPVPNVKVKDPDGDDHVTVISNADDDEKTTLVKFTTRKSGKYAISVRVVEGHIDGSPFEKTVLSGDVCMSKSHIDKQEKRMVVASGISQTVMIVLRDQYGNLCSRDAFLHEQGLRIHVAEPDSVDEEAVVQSVKSQVRSGYFRVTFTLPNEGYFDASMTYFDQHIIDADLGILCVSPTLYETVMKSTEKDKKSFQSYFEAKVCDVEKQSLKHKKVYCYISPKQISIKEFKLFIFPKKLYTFRLCPGTKFFFGYQGLENKPAREDSQMRGSATPPLSLMRRLRNRLGRTSRAASVEEDFEIIGETYVGDRRMSAADVDVFSGGGGSQRDQMFTLDDGYQKVTLLSKHRDELGALFIHFLSQKMGGSRNFRDKQDFFQRELIKHHKDHSRKSIQIDLNRRNILSHAMEVIGRLHVKDWCKAWSVSFENERGVDWGGLGRELFVLLFDALLDPSEDLFQRFKKDDPQALLHPSYGANNRLKDFEFAGRLVGKCLYETAQGNPRYVKARFSRSFLAQLVGLRVTGKHFESDDPEFYVAKIKYIKENDVDDLELVFAEDLYVDGNLKTFPLKPNGEDIMVTNANKLEYLDLMTQFRLVDQVRSQIEAFVKGLSEIVPIDLLSVFDENELELLMCGASKYNVKDLRKYSKVDGFWVSSNVTTWFWSAVSSFTQEEMAQLLQFTTGSSQIPPGGLSELSPKFTVTHSSARVNGLPTAHTCFNQICLPDYESYEQLQSSLLLAINEGSFGFEMI